MASSATFQAWVTEIVTTIFTTLGVTQTADTGQINPATVAVPGAINTSAGYVIGRFNDTLQATAPIFFKLEFGTGSAIAAPGMWLTVGTGSNGSGTITNGGGGAVTTRVAVSNGSTTLASTTTPFTSRYCYLATSGCGILHMEWKYGAVVAGNTYGAYAGFVIARSNDGNGNATAASVLVLSVGFSAAYPANSAANGYAQLISFGSSIIIPAIPVNGWEAFDRSANIYSQATLIEGTTGFTVPIYLLDPVLKYSAYVGTTLVSDFALGTTSTFAIIGTTPITFISSGGIFGSASGYNSGAATKGLVLPWQ